jgi:hypothetical protein
MIQGYIIVTARSPISGDNNGFQKTRLLSNNMFSEPQEEAAHFFNDFYQIDIVNTAELVKVFRKAVIKLFFR